MQKKWIITIIVTVILIIGCVIVFTILNKTDKLNGLWEYDNNTRYEFDGKGKGKIIVPMENIEFSYTIKDTILSVDYKNKNSIDTNYEFKVSKDNLELTDLNQPDVKLKLKKVKE